MSNNKNVSTNKKRKIKGLPFQFELYIKIK